MLRSIAQFDRRVFWALADQGVASLGNFATAILLARGSPVSEYGVYVLLFSVLVVTIGVHRSLVTFPLTLRGAPATPDQLAQFTVHSLYLTVLLSVPLGVIVFGAAVAVGRPDLGPWAVAAMVMWHLQETLRRSLLARMRYRDAVWGDALSYLGQAVIMGGLMLVGKLSLDVVFPVVAISSAAAALVQAHQVGGIRLVRLSDTRVYAARNWAVGRWRLAMDMVTLFVIHAFPWALTLSHGTDATAEFQAVVNIAALSNPAIFAIGDLITVAAARHARAGGQRTAIPVSVRYASLGALIVLPYYALLLLWPQVALGLFYGPESPYLGQETALRVLIVAYVLLYLELVPGGTLTGLGRVREAFSARLLSAVCVVFVGLPLVAQWDVRGAALGRVIAEATAIAAGVVILLRTARSKS